MASLSEHPDRCGCGHKPVVIELSCEACGTQVRQVVQAKDHPKTWGLPSDVLDAFSNSHHAPRVFVLGVVTQAMM